MSSSCRFVVSPRRFTKRFSETDFTWKASAPESLLSPFAAVAGTGNKPRGVDVVRFPVGQGHDDLERQPADARRRDHDGGSHLADLGPDGGVEVDQPDVTPPRSRSYRHKGPRRRRPRRQSVRGCCGTRPRGPPPAPRGWRRARRGQFRSSVAVQRRPDAPGPGAADFGCRESMNASTCGQRSVGNRRSAAVIVCSVTGTADMTTLLSFLQFYKSALRPSKRDKCPPCVFSHFYSENEPRPIPRFSRQPARGGCGVESCDGPSGERGERVSLRKRPPRRLTS